MSTVNVNSWFPSAIKTSSSVFYATQYNRSNSSGHITEEIVYTGMPLLGTATATATEGIVYAPDTTSGYISYSSGPTINYINRVINKVVLNFYVVIAVDKTGKVSGTVVKESKKDAIKLARDYCKSGQIGDVVVVDKNGEPVWTPPKK